jgi:hypothetical protein
MLTEMNNKDVNIESVAEKALVDRELLSEILDGLISKQETLRYNCLKVLLLISKTRSELLYPKWDYFVKLLDSDNSYLKMSATQLIAKLTKVDIENNFEKIIEKYYSLLNDRSMIVAIYVANNSGKIIKAKPHLESQITNKLLDIDRTHHPEGRKLLIKAGAIEAFEEYFIEAANKDKIIAFVKEQLDCDSPKTRKLAKNFLRKWDRLEND